MRNVKNDSFF